MSKTNKSIKNQVANNFIDMPRKNRHCYSCYQTLSFSSLLQQFDIVPNESKEYHTKPERCRGVPFRMTHEIYEVERVSFKRARIVFRL